MFAAVSAAAAQTPSGRPTGDRTAERISPAEALATFDSAWSRVRNAHYDTAMRGIDWARVREELRPRAERAATLGELRGVLSEMLERLGESHYGIIRGEVAEVLDPGPREATSNGPPGDVGVSLRLLGRDVVVSQVVAGGPADRAGVKAGWIVDSVGRFSGRRISERVARLRTEAERRQSDFRLTRAVDASFLGPAGSVVRAAFRDGAGRRVVVSITRRATPGEPVQFSNLPTFLALLEHERRPLGDARSGSCVGVIRFNIWMPALADDFDRAVDAVRDCRGIVVDLRGNPGGLGFMVAGVGGHFLDSTASLGTMRTRAGELRFTVNPRRATSRGEPVRPYAGPLAILVDPLSGSTSEVFAAGMQAIGRARVFGETSAGQALPAMATRLPTGDVLLHVTADLVAPDGRRVEGRGVVPDEPVPLRREDLLAGRDAALEAAVRWIETRP
ncbi:MAG: S41 family peptidase [Gemmatimonadota bacterium]|nr:S41 family peptidase [Gemmatimonadota bacterium]